MKNLNVETIRGLAIVLVVMGHVIGVDTMGGMKVADDSVYRYIYCLFENIRMPLFTVISGLIYAKYPLKKGYLAIFLKKKVRRLIVPMTIIGTLYFLIQYIVPGTNATGVLSEIWRIYIYPYTYFWYLPALFLVFLTIFLLEISNLFENIRNWAVLLIVSLVLSFAESYGIIPKSLPNLFAFKNALFLLPFFIFGLGLHRFKSQLLSRRMVQFYVICAIIGVGMQQCDYFDLPYFSFYEEYRGKIITGLVASAFLLSLNWHNKFFIWIATYAYSIYLFHGFGTQQCNFILKSFGVTSDFLIFAITLLIAMIVPIFVDKIFSRWNLTRLLFLGKGRKIAEENKKALHL